MGNAAGGRAPLSGATTLRRTLTIALVVGTLLSLVNQGGRIVAGEFDAVTWLRILANYFIPWAVSSVGFLSATRKQGGLAPRPRQADLET